MRLHVVDGTYELFRAYFSKRPDHRAPDGRERKATVGLAASMLFLLEDKAEAVTHLAIAFDNPIRSVRNDWYDGYKTDEGVPADLLEQFDPAEEAMRALGIVVWSMKDYEADDALATAAVRWQNDVDQVRVMTPDKDLGQVLRGTKVVQVDRLRQKETDEAALIERRGVRPESIPDWLALVGDDADGIPGIPGFGEKTAAALLRVYGHLEQIPTRAADWKANVRGADRLASSLQERKDDALLYRKLATLITDVPLRETLADLEWKGVPREAFAAWCRRLGVRDLESRPTRFR
jgi:5'-3' exonuclease